MSNEELAVLVQAGERERLVELWGQTRRLVLKKACRWVVYRSGGAELEDLEQAGFIAVLRAADSFDPAAGCQFSTWLQPFMLGEFTKATGRKTARQAHDPLNGAVSLDMPACPEEENSSTLGEFLPDEQAENAFADVERREDLYRLHALLMEAVDTLAPYPRAAVMAQYWGAERIGAHSKTFSGPCGSCGIPAYPVPWRSFCRGIKPQACGIFTAARFERADRPQTAPARADRLAQAMAAR